MKSDKLSREFLRLCRELDGRSDVLHTEVEQEKQMTLFSLYFRVIKVQLVYSRRWETVAPPSVLYCRVYLSKNDPMYLHLPELMCYLKAEDYRACYFPYIETPQRMAACFRALMDILDDYIPAAERLGITGQDRAIMEHWATHGFIEDPDAAQTEPGGEINWETMLLVRRMQESFLVGRHTMLDAYDAFLLGKREKALEKYEKMEKSGLSDYEKGLCRFLRDESSRDFQPMPAECFALQEYKATTGQKADWKGIGLLYVVCAAVSCGLVAAVHGFLSRGTVHYLGMDWWYGLIPAALPAIFGYFVFQRQLQGLLGGKKARSRMAFLDMMKPHPWVNRLAVLVFAVAAAGCLLFCTGLPVLSSMRFYDTHAVYFAEEGTAARLEYAQVEEIYYISARYNEYGGRVERASYVLVLEDGRQMDLDMSCALDDQRALVQRFFSHAEIRNVDSDRDLPPQI